ncbi:MAG: WD40 repeat domain-containing protein, partial [Haloferula sp.]
HAVGHRGPGGIVASAWDSHVSPQSKDPKQDRYSLAFATAGNDSVIIWSRDGRVFTRFHDVTRPAGVAFSSQWFYMAGAEGIVRRAIDIRNREPFGPFLKNGLIPCIMNFGPPQPFSDLDHCRQIKVTPDGKQLAVTDSSGIWLVDTKDGSKQLVQQADPNTAFDIDSEGRWLAVGNRGEDDGRIHIYDLPQAPEDPIQPTVTLDAPATAITFSHVMEDGTVMLGTGNSHSYQFWNVKDDWAELEALAITNDMDDRQARVVFSPRSTALAVSYNEDKLKVLNPRTTTDRMEILTRPGFDSQWPLAISSDGALIGTEGHDGRLFIWNLQAVREEFKQLGIDWTTMGGFKKPLDMRILIGVTTASSAGEQ